MSVEVYKAVIVIEMMGTAASAAAFESELGGMSIEEMMEECDTGGMVAGTRRVERIEHIHRDDVQRELEAVGSDGTFFELEEDDPEGVENGEQEDRDDP